MSGCPACDDDEGRRPAGYPGPMGAAACRLETTEVDYLKDGSIDLVIDNTYDVNGFLVRTVEDVPPYADGLVQRDTAYTNDAQGRVVEEVSTFFASGMSFTQRTTNFYDQDGNLGLVEIDGNGDGVVDMTVLGTYDGDGHLLAEERFGAGDMLLERRLFTYNDHGDLLQVDRDAGGDGVIDETTVHTVDGFGNRTLTEVSPAGGSVATRITFEYKNLKLVTMLTVDVASGFAQQETYVYDTRGNRIGSTYDIGNDGTIEQSATSLWICR